LEFSKQDQAAKNIHHGNSEGYEDAVILVALVNAFGTEPHPFTAFDCQKFPYLFHRHMEGVAKGYKKFAAGPYNPNLKFRTARPIALGKNYIRECVGKYKGFVTGENAKEAIGYFSQWYGDEPLKWLEQFRFLPKRKDELELLTTTDKAIVELQDSRNPITLFSVKELIKKSPAWKDKLKRSIFSDANIIRAIKWSNDLFGKKEAINGEN
jgi:type I restriction enzyme S subunit